MRYVRGAVSVGAGYLLAPDARVTVSPRSVVKDATGNVIGRILSGEAHDGDIVVIMEIEDDEFAREIWPPPPSEVNLD